MRIQPFKLAYTVANGDAGFCKIVKYITRVKGDRNINLQKALHVVDMLEEETGGTWRATVHPQALYTLKYAFEGMKHSDKYVWISTCLLEGEYSDARNAITELLEPVDHV